MTQCTSVPTKDNMIKTSLITLSLITLALNIYLIKNRDAVCSLATDVSTLQQYGNLDMVFKLKLV